MSAKGLEIIDLCEKMYEKAGHDHCSADGDGAGDALAVLSISKITQRPVYSQLTNMCRNVSAKVSLAAPSKTVYYFPSGGHVRLGTVRSYLDVSVAQF